MRARGKQLALGGLCVIAIATLAVAAQRVNALERMELQYEGKLASLAQRAGTKGSTPVSARLGQAALRRGDHAIFELCARDRLEPASVREAFELVVFRLPSMELMLRVALDDQHLALVRRNQQGACLSLGGGPIEKDGEYSIDAVWVKGPPSAAVQQIPLQARILARVPLGPVEQACVVLLGLVVLAGLAVGVSMKRSGEHAAVAGPSGAASRLARGPLLEAFVVGSTLVALLALTQVPTATSTWTLGKGVALVLLQALVPLWLLSRLGAGEAALPLQPRQSLGRAYALVLAAALVLVLSAKLALELVPATGEAPIQSFVSWPSGMLCFAALGVILPVGEEIFFRGYLFGSVLRWSGRIGPAPPRSAGAMLLIAGALSWLVFVALHAQQSWGNWGGLVSIAVAGLVLTALRIHTGSVLASALAHVLYNFVLSLGSIW